MNATEEAQFRLVDSAMLFRFLHCTPEIVVLPYSSVDSHFKIELFFNVKFHSSCNKHRSV